MHPLASALLTALFPQENACHLCGRWAHRSILCEQCLAELARQRIKYSRQAQYRRDGLRVALACWKHQSIPRRLVHHLKYQGDPRAAVLLGEGMTEALQGEKKLLESVDLVVPVPLHPEREKTRGYNQAALLTAEICRLTGLKAEYNLLFRTHATGAQVYRNKAERLAAMRGAFAVANAEALQGRRILLVDDVFTTGATALACAGVLLHAGAQEVNVITACRA